MGYNTRYYGLTIDRTASDPASVAQFEADAGAEVYFDEYAQVPVTEQLEDYDSMKWYGWEKDCIKLSLRYPNLLFSLYGEGEETGDMWKAWFRNGKSHVVRPEVVIPTPDNLDDLLPKIPEDEMKKRRLRVELADAERRVEELRQQLVLE